jgi:hypothetical protein
MTIEEKIRASIRRVLDAERGLDRGFATVEVAGPSVTLILTPPPILVVIREHDIISASRPFSGPQVLQLPSLDPRKDVSDEEGERYVKQWADAVPKAKALLDRGEDAAIVVHTTKPARAELRAGPNFGPPAAS